MSGNVLVFGVRRPQGTSWGQFWGVKSIKIDPKHSEDLKRLLLTIPSISKIDVLNETESNVNINIYPKENRVILTEVAKIIADHKFPARDIYQNHIALDEAFRKLTV